ncbi:MAG TPA: hypothetical protein VK252_03540 [Solirubrobacteraceae bacterium]|nr:hypothetical protein [Solirubrobacteraceae bacterium]
MDNTPDQQKSPPAERKSSHEGPKPTRERRESPLWAGMSPFLAPSPRVTAALAAAMLAIGVAVGAAIGPAPSTSFAGSSGLPLPVLLRMLGVGAARPSTTGTASVQPPPVAETATPAPARRRRRHSQVAATQEPANTTAPSSETSAPAEAAPTLTPTPAGKGKASTLAPVTKVWLIELSGSGFGEAAAQPAAAPYIDTQAVHQGTLLSGWSALDASSFANDAALLASTPPQLLDTIVQPPCGEGATAAQCAPDTPGGIKAADEFLEQVLPTITATGLYRENGLIVVTFATVASATATGLPSGATTATLTSQPPAGALLISPFVTTGAQSSIAFTPQSPAQSLEKLLRDNRTK